MRFLIATLLVGLASGFATADPIPKEKEKTALEKQAEKVIGKWRIVKSNGTEINGTTVEFTKDGKMTISMDEGKTEFKGKYKVTKEGIDYKVSLGETEKAEVLTIKKLEEKTMTTEDPEGVAEEFERIEVKKKESKN